ncbi:hypothetical protein ACSVH2_08790 [Flavobacterium sp. RSB2_4_14]|uniref:hypothetical protein n=1 Tax=Flavobacterium sp. RSB2_4_14 TaxID=3447665 RepID=UPI003F402CE7
MNKYITAVLITAAFLSSNNSFAWSEKGHALVAQVALNYLDANTKKIVNQYPVTEQILRVERVSKANLHFIFPKQ